MTISLEFGKIFAYSILFILISFFETKILAKTAGNLEVVLKITVSSPKFIVNEGSLETRVFSCNLNDALGEM